jgi:hypothetical protein
MNATSRETDRRSASGYPWAAAWIGLGLGLAAAAAAVNALFGDFPIFTGRFVAPLAVIPSGLLVETVLLVGLSLGAGALVESARRLFRAPPSWHVGAQWSASLLLWLYASRAACFMGIRRGLGRYFAPPEMADLPVVWGCVGAAVLVGAAAGFFWGKRETDFLRRASLKAAVLAAASAGGYALIFQRWREARSYPLPPVLPHLAVLAALLAAVYLLCRASSRGLRRFRRGAALAVAAAALALTAYYSYPAASGLPSIAAAVVDAARGDRLSCFGYPSATSPNLDRIASGAVVFSNAYSVSNYTYPSHVTFFTGKEYREHDYQIGDGKEWKRYQKEATLADALAERGYHTVLFTENPWVLATDKGFAEVRWFDYPMSFWGPQTDQCEFGPHPPSRNFAEPFLGRRLLDWLSSLRGGFYPLWADAFQERAIQKLVVASRRSGPVFLFLNWMTVHERMHPSTSWSAGRECRGYDFADEYDLSIRHVDRRLERLNSLFRGGGREGCLVVTSDHGELLGEYGQFGHNKTLFPEVLRVPLIVAGPGLAPAAVSEPVSLKSFYRLILLLASGRARTEDVVELFRGGEKAVAEHGYLKEEWSWEFDWCYTVIDAEAQYIFYPKVEKETGSWPRDKAEALFLAGAPRAPENDRSASEPALLARLREYYQARVRSLAASRPPVSPDSDAWSRQEQTLRSLGYLQ